MGLQGRGKALPGGEGFPKLLRYALDTPADGTELFFDAAVAAVDMPAFVVHERFALGTESGEDECRARAQVGRADGRTGQIRRTFYDGDAVFYADVRAEPREFGG